MRLAIFDEECLFSEALAALLTRRDHQIAGCFRTWSALSPLAIDNHLDACLVTIRSGRLDVLSGLARTNHHMAIVALSATADPKALLNELKSGADGICLTSDGIDDIEQVLVRSVAKRALSDGPLAPEWSRGALAFAKRRGHQRATTLTPKERSVLELLVRGMSTPKIASDLGVGEATVRTHLQHLFNKFGVHSRLALVAHAIRTGTIRFTSEPAFSSSL